jgi:hypothetical protein
LPDGASSIVSLGLYLIYFVLGVLAVAAIYIVANAASIFALQFAHSIWNNVTLPVEWVDIFVMDDWRPSTMEPWECLGWDGLLKLGAW